jgi:ATP-dependent Clp protease adaptor protein ClpS
MGRCDFAQSRPPGKVFSHARQSQYHEGRLSPSARIDMSDNGRRGEEGPGTGVIVKPKAKTKKPSMYKVLMLNDDYTPMEFVVMVLQEYFKRDLETATQIMLKIHHEGRGVCGVYSKDVAATKVELVLAAARRGGHPLQCIMEAA